MRQVLRRVLRKTDDLDCGLEQTIGHKCGLGFRGQLCIDGFGTGEQDGATSRPMASNDIGQTIADHPAGRQIHTVIERTPKQHSGMRFSYRMIALDRVGSVVEAGEMHAPFGEFGTDPAMCFVEIFERDQSPRDARLVRYDDELKTGVAKQVKRLKDVG